MHEMEWHPDEDDLILLFYEDGPSETRTKAMAHLDRCPTCLAAFQDIRQALALVTDAEVPAPRPGFEARLWAAVAAELPGAAPRFARRPFTPLLAWAALLMFVVMAGYGWVRFAAPASTPPAGPVAVEAGAGLQERVLLTALDQHFGQTETLLVELLNAPDHTANELVFERATADDLVWSGRLYRASAHQTGDERFADVLDDLESVLVEVARSPTTVADQQLQAWRDQIEDHGLLFKVRTVTREIRERQGALTPEGAL
jgi:hypothetical protein